MIIYVDSDYKCHAAPGEGLREFDVPYFNNKCEEFIEGYRYVPEGEEWTREDGEVFTGLMITPWVNYETLDKAQIAYERDELVRLRELNQQYEAALSEIETALGV